MTLSMKQFNALSTEEKLDKFTPGITLPESQRKKLPKDYLNLERVSVAIFGGVGSGKTSFVESCKHCFNGLKVREFEGVSNQRGKTNTQHSEGQNLLSKQSFALFEKLTLYDSEGMINFNKDISSAAVQDVVRDTSPYWKWLCNFLTGTTPLPQVQCVILVWPASSDFDTIQELKIFYDLYSAKMKGARPLILVTKIDDNRTGKSLDELRRDVQGIFPGNEPFLIQNYTKEKPEANENTKEVIDDIISMALTRCDLYAYAQSTNK